MGALSRFNTIQIDTALIIIHSLINQKEVHFLQTVAFNKHDVKGSIMQVDLFGNPIGGSHSVVDILGQEHKSVATMIEFWNKEYESISPLESPPHFFLRANPVTPTIAISERDETIRIIDPNETIISGDRNSSIYRLFNYHTKVNPEIARAFIETYTTPGQLVIDPFCGSGMLGLGAHHGLEAGEHRKVILSDLSPAAAHLAWAYNSRPRTDILTSEKERILRAVTERIGVLYGASPTGANKSRKTWGYQVWSDVVKCPSCSTETTFIEVERTDSTCPNCSEQFSWSTTKDGKKGWERVKEIVTDPLLDSTLETVRQQLCHTWYSNKKGYQDRVDLELEEECQQFARQLVLDTQIPIIELPDGENLNQPKKSHGLTHVHHFYTPRNLAVLAVIHEEVEQSRIEIRHVLRQAALSIHTRGSIRNRYLQQYGHRHVGVQSGTLYVPPVREEINLIEAFDRRLTAVISNLGENETITSPVVVSVQSATNLEQIPDDSIDYGLTDPPFGSNINYSDLNFLGEAWLDSFTDISQEAIINKSQGKDLGDYGNLMRDSFREMHRVLRPGAFLTIIFQNSDNEIWNEIQRGLIEVGFETHDVVIVDKGKGTIKALSSDHGTGQDIAITMRKTLPDETVSKEDVGVADDLWEHIDETIAAVPLGQPVRDENGRLNPRHIHALFPMMLRFYLSRDLEVPYTVAKFLEELQNRYTIEDGLVTGRED
jgi:DNA modification methylase